MQFLTYRHNKVAEVKLAYNSSSAFQKKTFIKNSADIYALLLNHWNKGEIEHRESLKVLLLNSSNRVLGIYTISEGGISETTIDLRLILQAALLSNASNIILAHNHPSGNLTPSLPDIQITNRIKETTKLFNISLLEHLIISKENYYSFADEGKL